MYVETSPVQNDTFTSRIKYYCKTTHLHGLKYVESSERNIFIRIFWAVIFLIFFSGMTVTFASLLTNYRENSVSFLTETTYLDWNTTFPAVTVCQIAGMDLSLIEEPFDGRDNTAAIEFFIADLLFFAGSCYSCNAQCYSCPSINISRIVKKLRKPCTDILGNCEWNGALFRCCERFLPLETEYGICFSINSLHTKKSLNDEGMNLQVNRQTGIGELFIETTEDVRVYFHAPEDVPFINSESNYRTDVMRGESYEVLFNVMEIHNDESIIDLPTHKRECRYPRETPADLKVHELYSYSTCLVQCHAENHLRLCNCTHHLMPYYNKRSYCDIEGLKCLMDNFEIVSRLHAKGSDKPGLFCDCLPSCTEPEYNVVSNQQIFNRTTSGISVKMQSLPTSRFKRVVVKSTLDFVVSLGGAAGLFIGASILTIIELFYLLLMRR